MCRSDIVSSDGANLQDKALDDRIGEVWGVIRTTPRPTGLKLIAQFPRRVDRSGGKPSPDVALGRAMFRQGPVQQCSHGYLASVGKVGTGRSPARIAPTWTTSWKNILDPSAVIPKEYCGVGDRF